MPRNVTVTGVERTFGDNDIIVSKTNLKGHITYANDVFLKIADFTEKEVLGQPHSLIRHPQMPRCVFKLLWQTVEAGQEIFAYVINRTKYGDHYWVYAHVTPSRDRSGRIIGYHSNRRVPDREILEDQIIPLYRDLLQEEARHGDRKAGMLAGEQMMMDLLAREGVAYDEYIATLGKPHLRASHEGQMSLPRDQAIQLEQSTCFQA
ncbi:PAS domain-containing protein [Roseibium polysiphoniae]|uniref:PAS domain-containing protein n=1 Tax=Roseibium polysiphoniae TaxID=2571221 RepID=A0A944GR32_9HYPH|nr:PAS domain-containing protein [Roseibium polysiphoniae]